MARHRPSGFTHFGIELAVRMTLLHFGRCVYRVIATFTAALAAGADTESAARLANFAGGIVVMKRGTATVSAQELIQAIEHAEK